MQIDSYFPYIISAYIVVVVILFAIGVSSVMYFRNKKSELSSLDKK